MLETTVAPDTRQAIFEAFFRVAMRGFDVQDFDPASENLGTKPALASQRGYYGDIKQARVAALAALLENTLEAHREEDALGWFETVRRLPVANGTELGSIPSVRMLRVLPDAFADVEPEDLRAPNGLRVPEVLKDRDAIQTYSATTLVPKLVLCAMAGLSGMAPWRDPDMDLGSAVHTIRPDRDKLQDGSGYGAANLPSHTDGYWSDDRQAPIWNVMLCVNNPFLEPTRFIKVADIFRVVESGHPEFDGWVETFRDLIPPGQNSESFLNGVVQTSLLPQFEFVMGQIGSGAKRAVRGVPLLEKHAALPGYRFRYKTTFAGQSDAARLVVEFVNRMVTYLSDEAADRCTTDVPLEPGAVLFSLNGTCLQVCQERPNPQNGIAYPVRGSATIHGRKALRITDGGVRRTMVRGNMVVTSDASAGPQLREADDTIVGCDPVWRLLSGGYRANLLER